MFINSIEKLQAAEQGEAAPDATIQESPVAAASPSDPPIQKTMRPSTVEKESLTQSYDYMEEMLQQQEDEANLDMASREPNDITGNQYYGVG